jgi:ABC-type branched-subunit amino acid transport system substrate-binding protein
MCARAAAFGGAVLLGSVWSGPLLAASGIAVGQLVTQTGATAQVASAYGQGVSDAFAYINKQGGINGKRVTSIPSTRAMTCRAPLIRTRNGRKA